CPKIIGKFSSEIDRLTNFAADQNFDEARNFGGRSEFWPLIRVLGSSQNIGDSAKFWRQVRVLAVDQSVGLKSKRWRQFKFLAGDLNVIQQNKTCKANQSIRG
ncbi:hypothetical protein Tcan_00601, partial [Toxocara canis]